MKSRYICISITTLLSLGFSLPITHAQSNQVQVAAGTNHNLVLTENGEVYGFGRNDIGALGLGDANRVDIPRLAGHPNLAGKTIIDVVPGGDLSATYMLILTADGQVFSFGFTANGQTGHPEGPYLAEPTRITAGGIDTVFVNAISTGLNSTTLATNRGLYVFGSNANGYIGVGNNVNPISAVTRLTQANVNLLPFKKVYTDYDGASYSIAENDSLFVWGRNSNGELGVGGFVNRLNPTELSISAFGGQKVTKFAPGQTAVIALTEGGKVYFSGYRRGYALEAFAEQFPGDINVPTLITHSSLDGKTFVDGALGLEHGLLLDDQGIVYGFGSNTSGQLGFIDPAVRNIPTALDPALFQHKPIVKLFTGNYQSYFIADDGTIFATGDGRYATLGNGFSEILFGPLPLKSAHFDHKSIQHISNVNSRRHVFFIATDGSFYSAGYDYFRSFSNPYVPFLMRERPVYNTPTQLDLSGLSGSVSKVRAGKHKSFLITQTGSVYGMGQAASGQLGLSDSLDVFVPTLLDQTHIGGKKIIDIASSDNAIIEVSPGQRSHTLLLSDDGLVYAFGSNQSGQLGLGDTQNRRIATPVTQLIGKTIVHIAVGNENSMAIADDGTVYLWGKGGNGEMGFGNSDDLLVPTLATHLSATENHFVSGAIGSDGGRAYFLLIANDGTVFSFGDNSRGQLGLGNTVNQYTPTLITAPSISGKKMVAVLASDDGGSMIRAESGEIYGFGRSHRVGFDRATFHNTPTPTLLPSASIGNRATVDFSLSRVHSLLALEDGTILVAQSQFDNSGNEGTLGNGSNYVLQRAHLPVNNFSTYSSPIPTTNLALHLDAGRVGYQTANDSVSTWLNLAGTGFNAVHPGLGFRPLRANSAINNRPALRFNGTNSYLTLPTATDLGIQNSDYEVFIVAKSGSSGIQFLLAGETIGQHEVHLNGAAGLRFIPVADPAKYVDVGTSGDFTNDEPQLYNVQATNTFGQASVNRAPFTRVDANTHSPNSGIVFLGRRTDNTFHFNGDIAEVIIYNGTLSEQDRNTVEVHLFNKYGIQNYKNESAQLTGTEGWRLLASPVADSSYASFFRGLWTQGFPGASVSHGTPNVYTWPINSSGINASQWTPLANASATFTPGQGILAYIYSDDDGPGNETNAGFPKTLRANGFVPNSHQNLSSLLNPNPEGWTLLGNPFSQRIDWDLFTSENMSGSVYVWDPNGAEWKTWNGTTGGLTDGYIAPFNGFFVETMSENPTLTVPTTAIAEGTGTFYGKSAGMAPSVVFSLEVEHASGLRNRAWFEFSEEAEAGKDARDAYKMAPLSTEFVQLGSLIASGSVLDINHLPLIDGAVEVPLHVNSSRSGAHTLRLNRDALPHDWKVTLEDTELQTSTQLEQAYDFYAEAPVQKRRESAGTVPHAELQSATASRFVLHIELNTTSVDREQLPTSYELAQNYPNPFNPTTTISYALPVVTDVRLEVFDMLGRRVATLVRNETHPAGTHTVTFDASRFTSGVYVYRLQAGSTTITRKLTLIK